MPVNREAAERAISDFLKALGFDPRDHAELADTPERVTEAFTQDLLRGHTVDVRELLRRGACPAQASTRGSLVAITDIAVASVCPHHLLPALGVAHVVYLPGATLLGIGTVAALVDAFARRLTLQEAIAENVVNALIEHAGARGAYCELTLEHGCLRARGERQAQARVRSSSRAGELLAREATAEIALALGRSGNGA
jgi:GTP cyclohydrolase I